MRLDGIHHISAITGDARRNVDFYTRVLGLRMIAKTVNQDDRASTTSSTATSTPSPAPTSPSSSTRARSRAAPAPAWSTGSSGASARPAALDFWAQRLAAEGTRPSARASLRFADPEGLGHELVVDAIGDAPLFAEHPEVPAEHALQGFEGVRAYSAHPDGSAACWSADGRDAARRRLRAARRAPRRLDRASTRPRRARPAERRHVHHIAWGTTRRRPADVDRRARPTPGSRTAASSTATTSTRSTSASRAASSTSSPPRSPASRSTARSRSSARG